MKNTPFSYTIDTVKNKGPVISLSYQPTNKKDKPVSVKIAPKLGSNMFSFVYDGYDIIAADPKLLSQCGFTGTFVLFPTPNRVENSTYLWQGKRIVQKKRGALVPIHGLVFDEPWSYTTPIATKNSVRVQTSIEINKTSPLFAAFPFLCTLTLTYELSARGVNVQYEVTNNADVELPFGFALHPYFNRLSGNSGTLVSVPAKSWMESPKETLLPTGELINVTGKGYDIRKPTPVGKLDLDHVYTDLTPNEFATVEYTKQKIKVTLKTSKDFTHAVVYTGDKNAVCIENQTCSTNAHNLFAKGLKKESHLMVIPAHKTFSGYITYSVFS